MTTHSIPIQSPNEDPVAGARRILGLRRSAAASGSESPDRRGTTPQASGARVLRRWSVTDLIARAGGAPRAFA